MKVTDEDFIRAYVESSSREEVARKTGLAKSSVTDRAAILRNRGFDLNPWKRPLKKVDFKKLNDIAERQTGEALMVAVEWDLDRAVALLTEEARSKTSSRICDLLDRAGELDRAIRLVTRLCRQHEPLPEAESDYDPSMDDESKPPPGSD